MLTGVCFLALFFPGMIVMVQDYDDYGQVVESVLKIRDFHSLDKGEASLIEFMGKIRGDSKIICVSPILDLLISDIRNLRAANELTAKEMFKKATILLDINQDASVLPLKLSESDVDKMHGDLVGFFGKKSYYVYITKSKLSDLRHAMVKTETILL